jgi:nucleoside-diphosphate-sugar epimerase
VIVNGLNAPYPDWARALPRQTSAVIAAARASGATVMVPGNVYVYGSSMPEILSETTPHRPDREKGRLREEMEAALRESAGFSGESEEGLGESEAHSGESGARLVILRAGDFLEGAASGNWFDAVIAKGAAKGRVVYPGPLDRAHAWAYLPDFARAMVGLAEMRDRLAPVEEVGFPGYTLTGRELTEAIAAAAGRPMRNRGFPWWALRLAAPVWPMGRELLEMRYLWERPHRIDGGKLARLLPEFRASGLEAAMRDCLRLERAPSVAGAIPADSGFPEGRRA